MYEHPNILHGHAQCFDLVSAPHATWAMGEDTFVTFEGDSLKDFEQAVHVEYHTRTGNDVFVWWEALVSEVPARGWQAEKDKICADEECWGKLKKNDLFVSCSKCPRSYHLSCVKGVPVTANTNCFECKLLDRTCTNRITPLLK